MNYPLGTGGTPVIDGGYDNVRKIDVNSPLSYVVQSGITIKLSCDSYTTSQVNTYLANKQDTISNNNTSYTDLLTSNTLRRLRAGSNITLSLVDGDVRIASTGGGITQSEVDSSIICKSSCY